MTINDLIKQRQDLRTSQVLKPNPTFASTHNKLLKLVDNYWNSQFGDSPYDSRGFRKPFLNAVRVPTFVSAKATDLDTKNIRIFADEGQYYGKAYIFNKMLKYYFKEIGFDKLLNEITYNRPKYGHIVLKKVRDKIYVVPIANIYSNPLGEKMASPIVEYHEYSLGELDAMGWENTDKVKAIYEKNGKDMAICWEITGKVSDDDYNYRIVAGLEYGKPIYLLYGNVENNYKELKWEDVPGRHQGRGVVEEQFESQIAINENEYLFRLGLQWTSKHLFWSKDVQTARNLLTDAFNGDVVPNNQPIEAIPMEERNLGAFQYADMKWQQHSNDQTFSSDILRGDRPPSGTPATTSVLQAQQAGGYYDLKREDAGIFIKSVIEDWILPDFKKKNSKAQSVHIMKLLGNDNGSQQFFSAILSSEVNKKVIDFMSKGKMLSGNELQLIKGITADGLKGKNVQIPDNFFDFEYSVDVVVTGEQVDLASRATALQTAFQVIGSNPTILQDPIVRRTYFKLLEATGVNPAELFDEEMPSLMGAVQNTLPGSAPVAQRGGSIAKAMPTPVGAGANKVPTTL